ncbi:ROK family protein [Microlunatus ginsengisoli]|uniref:ROK family protein n=1 Tax=Microlunatus ginsengisoli TaxID=363863 RepID=A0ABP6ZHY5_9ACTN
MSVAAPDEPGIVLAVDIGGTLTKLAWAAADGTIGEVTRVSSPRSAEAVSVDGLAEVIAERAAGRDGVRGFGLVAPGIVDADAGLVRTAPNLGWLDVALRDRLERLTGLPGAVGHDVRTAGLAEWRLHQPNETDLLFVALGTGIAGAPVVDGRLLAAGGYAGEIGHWAVAEGSGRVCACGRMGCLETVASAAGIVREYVRLGGAAENAAEVADLARRGYRAALDTFARAAAALGEALGRYNTLLGPRLVVLGGGLSGAADLLIPPVTAVIRAGVTFEREPRIVRAGLGADAGVIGAGLLGWDRVGRPEEAGRG